MLGTNESAKRNIDNGNEAAAMSAGRNAYMGQLPRSSRDDPWWLKGWDSAAEETQGKAALSRRIEKLLEQSADVIDDANRILGMIEDAVVKEVPIRSRNRIPEIRRQLFALSEIAAELAEHRECAASPG